jgi:hypothetical protein
MKTTINKLHTSVEDFLNGDLKDLDWAHKPALDKWSKQEILGHLIDSAQINLQRFVRCTYEENFKLTYEQVEWVQANHYQQASIDDLITLWSLLNRQIIRVWENYPTDRLQAQCDNSKTTVGLHAVEWLAQDYVDHLNHHLKQINTL